MADWENYHQRKEKDLFKAILKLQIELLCWQDKENWHIELPSNKVSLPVMVVPVLGILSCSVCNTPATISKFIEGPNLDDIGMNRKELPFDIKELPFRLSLFSLSLREKLAYDRVSVIPRNVKFQSGFLIITDLFVDLSIFRGLWNLELLQILGWIY